MRVYVWVLCIAGLLACTVSARADSYQYTVHFEYQLFNTTAVFDSPTIITSHEQVPASGFGDIGQVYYVDVNPILGSCQGGTACFLIEGEIGGENVNLNESAIAVGTYYDPGGYGFVTIAETPEPSSFALLGTGLLGVTGVVRRRLARSRLRVEPTLAMI